MWTFPQLLLAGSALLLLSVVTSKASGKLGIPALLLFLAIGMLAGVADPRVRGFDNPQLAQSLGIVALVLSVFAGGLETDWAAVRPVLGRGNEFLIPSGGTVLEEGDSLLVLADRESLRETRRILHVRQAEAEAAAVQAAPDEAPPQDEE